MSRVEMLWQAVQQAQAMGHDTSKLKLILATLEQDEQRKAGNTP